MRNVKKRFFSVFGAILAKKGSFGAQSSRSMVDMTRMKLLMTSTNGLS